jgi:hypothetical protein
VSATGLTGSEVYKDILGVSDQEYQSLVADGHAGTEYI